MAASQNESEPQSGGYFGGGNEQVLHSKSTRHLAHGRRGLGDVRFVFIPDERQLIEKAKYLVTQLTPEVRPIFGAVPIASAIQDAAPSKPKTKSERCEVDKRKKPPVL